MHCIDIFVCLGAPATGIVQGLQPPVGSPITCLVGIYIEGNQDQRYNGELSQPFCLAGTCRRSGGHSNDQIVRCLLDRECVNFALYHDNRTIRSQCICAIECMGKASRANKLALSQVVSIAVVMRQVDAAGAVHLNLGVRTLAHSPEGNLIQRFLEKVAAEHYQLWGYNSTSADLPILLQRAIALAVLCPTFSKRAGRNGWDYHNKWSDAHMDILEIIGGYGSSAKKPKLGEFAVACGFSGKLDVDGAEMADLYLAGHLDEIAEYNETDAVTTHLLMLRVGLHTGLLPPDRYTTEIEAVEQLVAEQAAKGKAQFEKFASAWAALKP